jgi:hypothetical protein
MMANSPELSLKSTLDGVAVGVSAACLIHCLALPILMALVPAWSAWVAVPESFHFWVLVFALPFSLTVLWHSARRLGGFTAFWIGSAGLGLMTLALWVPDPVAEAVVTSSGAIMLALAHIMNWRRRAHLSFSRC